MTFSREKFIQMPSRMSSNKITLNKMTVKMTLNSTTSRKGIDLNDIEQKDVHQTAIKMPLNKIIINKMTVKMT